MVTVKRLLLILAAVLIAASVSGRPRKRNTDESKVGPYTLPSLLLSSNGTTVTTRESWERKRRREILERATSAVRIEDGLKEQARMVIR